MELGSDKQEQMRDSVVNRITPETRILESVSFLEIIPEVLITYPASHQVHLNRK